MECFTIMSNEIEKIKEIEEAIERGKFELVKIEEVFL